ncbi:MAG: hypothetical protein IBJ18_02050 [Phycisphaerales bacterium]|nr:hypothetical protein [Phycisphaerales bacterium]
MKNRPKGVTYMHASLAVVGIAACTAGLLKLLPTASASNASAIQPRRIAPMKGTDVAALLMRCGIDGESLAAAGATEQQAARVFADARTFLSSRHETFVNADLDYASKNRELNTAEQAVRSGVATPAQRDGLVALRASVAGLKSTRDQIISAGFTAAAASLNEQQRQLISTLHTNRGREVPIEYRASARSEADWVSLRDALSNARQQAQVGNSASPEAAATIQRLAEDSGGLVSTIRSRIDSKSLNLKRVLTQLASQ